jgi:hypothetical protein
VRVPGWLRRVPVSLLKESPMKDPAAGQGQIGLDCVQFPVGCRQHATTPTSPPKTKRS